MSFRSALYIGSVFHRRLKPKAHRFRYRLFWLLLDLDELEELARRLRLFALDRFGWLSLRVADHGDGSATPLRQQIEAALRASSLAPPSGRIALLCMPRAFGVAFNPLSLYFCFDRDERLAAVVHQVHNTFGARNLYALTAEGAGDTRQACVKTFFVSPFLPMGLKYEFQIVGPGERLSVAIHVSDDAGPVLRAAFAARREPLTDFSLLKAGLSVPAIGLKTLAAIHWEALRLWLKGVRFLGGPGSVAPEFRGHGRVRQHGSASTSVPVVAATAQDMRPASLPPR